MKKYPFPLFARPVAVFSILTLILMLASCKPSTAAKPEAKSGSKSDDPSGMPADLANMVLTDIPGSDTKYARQLDASGGVVIEGYIRNNQKTGQWILYGTEGDIGLINNYVDGKLEGVVMRMIYR